MEGEGNPPPPVNPVPPNPQPTNPVPQSQPKPRPTKSTTKLKNNSRQSPKSTIESDFGKFINKIT